MEINYEINVIFIIILFIEGELFGKIKMSKLYSMKHQMKRLKIILGEGMDTHYVTKAQVRYFDQLHAVSRMQQGWQG